MEILPIYGGLPAEKQMQVLRPRCVCVFVGLFYSILGLVYYILGLSKADARVAHKVKYSKVSTYMYIFKRTHAYVF